MPKVQEYEVSQMREVRVRATTMREAMLKAEDLFEKNDDLVSIEDMSITRFHCV